MGSSIYDLDDDNVESKETQTNNSNLHIDEHEEEDDSLRIIDSPEENNEILELSQSSVISLDDEEDDNLDLEINSVLRPSSQENNIMEAQENSNSTAITTNKKPKILMLNSSGSVGKTTIAAQLIAPYLYMNFRDRINLYTLWSYKKPHSFSSDIINIVDIQAKEDTFSNLLINIYSKDEPAIFDIGAEHTTGIALNALVDTSIIFGIDLFVVPLTKGQKEAIDALEVYSFIKRHNPNAKFVFILNRVAKNTTIDDICLHFLDFLGDKDLMVDATKGIIEEIEPNDRNCILLHDDNIINFSVREESTIFELAYTVIEETEQLLKKAIIENSPDMRFLSARKNNIAIAKKYYENSIYPAIERLNDIMVSQQ